MGLHDAFDPVEIRKAEAPRLDAAFDLFLAAPIVRFAMSMIPSGEHADALRVLVRAAFDAGVDVGVGEAMGRIGRIIAEQEKKK